MKELLIKWFKGLTVNTGILGGIIGGFWLVGITPVIDDKTAPEILIYQCCLKEHVNHSIDTDTALNQKIDMSDLIKGQEFLLEQKLNEEEKIKEECKNLSENDCSVRLKRWELEIEKRQKKLDHLRELYKDVEMGLIAQLNKHVE